MLNIINTINFGNTFALIGLLSLPIIFFIVKLYPPTPREKKYSSFFLLKDILKTNNTKSKFPLWLLILRLLLCLLIIIFFSDPYLKKTSTTENYKNYVIIADNGWSITSNYQNYKNIIKDISIEAENHNKELHIYFSSLEKITKPNIFKHHNEVMEFISRNAPLAQQTFRKNLNKILEQNNYFKSSKVFYIFSNFDSGSLLAQNKTLSLIKENNSLIEIINPIKKITFIKELNIKKEKLELKIQRKGYYANNDFTLKIFGDNSDVLFEKKYTFKSNLNEYKLLETFPLEVINQFFKIKILNESHAGATFYLDDYGKRVAIGLVAEDEISSEKPLLSPIYYIKKSLDQNHSIHIASIKKILEEKKSIIFLPSNNKVSKTDKKRLKNWVNKGGVLVRFSDKNIINQKNLYLDEKNYFPSLRRIAKDFSIQEKLSITPFKKNKLLSSLEIPNDLVFEKQLIIDNHKSDIVVLASLEDQSPLITMKYVGSGKVILFHVTSNNEWSNLPLSSLFKDIISKLLLVPLEQKIEYSEEMSMKFRINSYGELASPIKTYYYKNSDFLKENYPSFRNPAGIYENENLSIALNLSGNFNTESFFSNIDEKFLIKSNYEKSVFQLKNYILVLIFITFFLDMLINILLKNNVLLIKFFKNIRISTFLLVFLIILPIHRKIDASENYNNLFLAYVKTDNKLFNQIAFSGLNNLKSYLIKRTSISPKGVKEIDIINDKILYFPLIYWKVADNINNLEEKTVKKIRNYLNTGGIILFDIIESSRSGSSTNEYALEKIKALFSDLGIEKLEQISKDHTIARSYYLLKNFPGRFDNRNLLIDTDNLDSKDGVSSVIVGSNDWTGAWAVDNNNYPLYQVVPGGDRQREISFRFGINLMMYALTGNYKSDQVHNKSILERLKKNNN